MNDFFVADEERVIAPEFISDDNDIETSLRPRALDEYIGQEKAKENLKIYRGGKEQTRIPGSRFALRPSRVGKNNPCGYCGE